MIILPAIDLYGGKAVRLYKGDYDQMTVYSDNPVELARTFADLGASHLHVVDLEGARFGTTPHLDLVAKIASEVHLKIEIGGGIRSMETIEKYLSAGADKVILGTVAVTDSDLTSRAATDFAGHVAVGADVADGRVAIRGWMEKTDLTLDDFMARLAGYGISDVICTDISRDGAMRGANLELYQSLSQKYSATITASGGVSTLDDVIRLKEMGIYGAIIGKAYYTGAIDLREALEAAK